jgi:plasmid stabilization system protein ParE
MGNYSVELLPAAYDDLNEIFNYILIDNPTAAESMLDKIMTSLHRLENFPKSGVSVMDHYLKNFNFRMIIIEAYIAFYRLVDNKVYVYRILHSARDYVDLLKYTK